MRANRRSLPWVRFAPPVGACRRLAASARKARVKLAYTMVPRRGAREPIAGATGSSGEIGLTLPFASLLLCSCIVGRARGTRQRRDGSSQSAAPSIATARLPQRPAPVLPRRRGLASGMALRNVTRSTRPARTLVAAVFRAGCTTVEFAPQRHIPCMRAAISTRAPWLAPLAANSGLDSGQVVGSKRPSSSSGMKRLRYA